MQVKKFIKGLSLRAFLAAQNVGLFIAPRHYYVPLSAWRDLAGTKARWNRPVDLSSIDIDLAREIDTLGEWVDDRVRSEVAGNAIYRAAVEERAGPGYGYIEAQVLHGFMRALAPNRVIEIGSGVSTQCMLAASAVNAAEGRQASLITCIEPFPSASLKASAIRLVDKPVEAVDLTVFDQLEAGDLLFIDSSHAVRPCGDVSRIYLEILPRLKSGVFVHIHDIYLPYAFQRELRGYMQWMETALLLALLSGSPRYNVTLSLSHLHYCAPEALAAALPEYRPQANDGGLRVDNERSDRHFPSSTYLTIR